MKRKCILSSLSVTNKVRICGSFPASWKIAGTNKKGVQKKGKGGTGKVRNEKKKKGRGKRKVNLSSSKRLRTAYQSSVLGEANLTERL